MWIILSSKLLFQLLLNLLESVCLQDRLCQRGRKQEFPSLLPRSLLFKVSPCCAGVMVLLRATFPLLGWSKVSKRNCMSSRERQEELYLGVSKTKIQSRKTNNESGFQDMLKSVAVLYFWNTQYKRLIRRTLLDSTHVILESVSFTYRSL